ncbi:hypothetical protein [Ilumatobacter sp.]|uniref:hypothetical protein n=1 Tax=Ilumatobacter sp. TaxID=1967498 RepID=UPI003B51D880
MTTPRRLVPATLVGLLALAACGGSDDATDTTVGVTEPAPSTEAPEDFTESTSPADGTAADGTAVTATDTGSDADDDQAASGSTAEEPPATSGDAPATDDEPVATQATADGGAPSASGSEGASASLVEWAIDAPSEYTAGEVTFTATNDGEFVHEFVVIEGDGYEALPQDEGGKIIEDELPTGALLGRTDRLSAGSSEDLTVDLVAGSYVLLCNLGSGGNSHAGQGQRLDITVS